ncbi:MAG: metallophosphoesterase family protein [Pseudomonadota bacterium]
MTFAILADIHANSFALDAVLADMGDLGIAKAVILGDHLSGPIDAAGTAERLMARSYPSIRGNHDRWLIEQDPAAMGVTDRVSHAVLSRAHLDWLAGLPPTLTVFDDVFLCHGTPRSDVTYWLERVEPSGVVRAASRAETEAEAAGIEASLILCAHTHIPRAVRLGDGRMVVNPGSVGCPAYDDDTPVYHRMQTGTPHASYAIAERRGASWTITHRSVPYASDAAAAEARRQGRDDWAHALATGWYAR